MAYTAVPEVNTSDPWSASDHNTYIKDNFSYLKTETDKIPALTDPPKMEATVTTAFNSTTSIAAVSWQTEVFDTGSMFAAGSPTKITFTTAGLYLITFQVTYSSGTAQGYRHAGIYLSDGKVIGATTVPVAASGVTPICVSALYQFTAGQYIYCKVQSAETESVMSGRVSAVRLSD